MTRNTLSAFYKFQIISFYRLYRFTSTLDEISTYIFFKKRGKRARNAEQLYHTITGQCFSTKSTPVCHVDSNFIFISLYTMLITQMRKKDFRPKKTKVFSRVKQQLWFESLNSSEVARKRTCVCSGVSIYLLVYIFTYFTRVFVVCVCVCCVCVCTHEGWVVRNATPAASDPFFTALFHKRTPRACASSASWKKATIRRAEISRIL